MRVKIVKCSEVNKWYVGLIGEEFEVDSHLYLMKGEDGLDKMKRLTGYDWTNAFILTSDCEVVEEDNGAMTVTDTPIPLPEGYVNIESVFITSNGKRYRLVPEEEELVTAPVIEPELKTFEDCWAYIVPKIYIDYNNDVSTGAAPINTYGCHNHLPTIKSAKQIQAAIKIFVIHAALVKDYKYDCRTPHWEVCFHDDIKHGIYPVKVSHGICTQFMFPSEALAQKAIDINIHIWRQYYGLTD